MTSGECSNILKPVMEDCLKQHDKARLYYEIRGRPLPRRVGIDHLPQWERVAVVTDVGWVRNTVNGRPVRWRP